MDSRVNVSTFAVLWLGHLSLFTVSFPGMVIMKGDSGFSAVPLLLILEEEARCFIIVCSYMHFLRAKCRSGDWSTNLNVQIREFVSGSLEMQGNLGSSALWGW